MPLWIIVILLVDRIISAIFLPTSKISVLQKYASTLLRKLF